PRPGAQTHRSGDRARRLTPRERPWPRRAPASPASTCWSSRSRGGSRTQGQYPVRLESPPVRHHHHGMPAHACTDPKHHVHDAPAFVSAVERACRERGLRLTPIRAHVLGLIAETEQPIKAYDLLDRVREGRSEEHTSELQSRE